jgi:hypothetical protein
VLARARWAEYIDFPLDIVINEFRSLNTAVITFIEDLDAKYDYDRITVVIPEFVVTRWWEHLLHNQTALFLKAKLLFKENVAVVSVPYKITTKRP